MHENRNGDMKPQRIGYKIIIKSTKITKLIVITLIISRSQPLPRTHTTAHIKLLLTS